MTFLSDGWSNQYLLSIVQKKPALLLASRMRVRDVRQEHVLPRSRPQTHDWLPINGCLPLRTYDTSRYGVSA